jgi:non-heme chloroperoxidase
MFEDLGLAPLSLIRHSIQSNHTPRKRKTGHSPDYDMAPYVLRLLPDMPFITAQDGTQIYYRDWGTGTPVVLIHGWPLNGDMWDKQSHFLAQHGLRVINYDRRGYGRSGQPWQGYDYDTFATDLNSIMEVLDLHSAALVGFSMGGGEVVRYLSLYGESRVSKAVMISAVPPYLLKTEHNPEGLDGHIFAAIEQDILSDRPAFLKEFVPKFYGRTLMNHTVSEAVLEWTQSMALTASLRSTLGAANAWSTTDFRQEMKGIAVPIRIIQGTGDSTVPIEASGRRSAKLLPNASLSEYKDEPHGLFLTAADRLNQELLSFLWNT